MAAKKSPDQKAAEKKIAEAGATLPTSAIAKPGELFVSVTFIRKAKEAGIDGAKAETLFWGMVMSGEIEPVKTLSTSVAMSYRFADGLKEFKIGNLKKNTANQ